MTDVSSPTAPTMSMMNRLSFMPSGTVFDTGVPSSNLVSPMLTDVYEITMAYAYWLSNRHNDHAVFDLFFRKNPFEGEFTIFCGLSECIAFLNNFRFTGRDIDYIRQIEPHFDKDFFTYLENLDASKVRLYAIDEGSAVFPRIPLIRVEGPLAMVQLLETTFLVLINFASLMATNAARFRLRAGDKCTLLEYGLRRAQGPDGAMSASRYSYAGGFDSTSNVEAARTFNIDCKGTHAHSFVSSFNSISQLPKTTIVDSSGTTVEFVEICQKYRTDLGFKTNEGELAAFIAYAQAFNNGFLALIDTYNILGSGLYNFLAVALALNDVGHRPLGVRIDSGDLAYFSNECRHVFIETSRRYQSPVIASLKIYVSSDINEEVLHSLNLQRHSIDAYGIGTHLVTCQKQPALGCVFKLVEVNGMPRIKVSADIGKVTIPGRKIAYRLFNADNVPIVDLLMLTTEEPPKAGQRVRCNHPTDSKKRCDVIPTRVEKLHQLYWNSGKLVRPQATLDEVRNHVHAQVHALRDDHLRYVNPTPFKVSLSAELFKFMNALWLAETPVLEIR